MESYVVHIFRRPGQDGEVLVGLVERIGNGERKAFHGEKQLLDYLALSRRLIRTRKRPPKGRDMA